MELQEKIQIEIKVLVNAPVQKVWNCWTNPDDITGWNFASPDWCCPKAENDLRIGGKFSSRMEAKNGSFGFDFSGKYTNIITHQLIEYVIGDGRRVKIIFNNLIEKTEVIETFEAENQNPVEVQRGGWQAILNNFKTYTQGNQ